MTIEGASASGNPEAQSQLNETVPLEVQLTADPQATPGSFEQSQIGSPSNPNPVPTALQGLQREYIWGMGDGGTDELLVMFNDNRTPYYPIQDSGGDIVALCDIQVISGVRSPRVTAQWTFDAYGQCQSYESFQSHPLVSVGHKGLFCDRLDGVVWNSSNADGSPRIIPFARVVYHNRNRMYAPGIGRFMQRDPNGTAMTLIDGAAFHGSGVGAIVSAFSVETQYGDGGNLYEYLGSNPRMRFDVLGLSWDPFDMVDDFAAEQIANRAATLNMMGQNGKAAAITAANILSWMPFPAAGIVGDLALYALGEISPAQLAASMALNIVPFGKVGKLASNLTGFVGRITTSFVENSAEYFAKHNGSSPFRKSFGKGFAAVGEWAGKRKTTITGCGCFVASTMVWTPNGMAAIDTLVPGDAVVTFNEQSQQYETQQITGTIEFSQAALCEVATISTDGTQRVLQTTDEHPFWTSRGWVRADSLVAGDQLKTMTETVSVLSVRLTSERRPVFNLEVAGNRNFLVGPDGALVHNCDIGRSLDFNHVGYKGHPNETVLEHLKKHEKDTVAKKMHGVFADDAIATTTAAFNRYRLDQSSGVLFASGRKPGTSDLYVDMGTAIGLQGGSKGNIGLLNRVKIVFKAGTNEVITAYPVLNVGD